MEHPNRQTQLQFMRILIQMDDIDEFNSEILEELQYLQVAPQDDNLTPAVRKWRRGNYF